MKKVLRLYNSKYFIIALMIVLSLICWQIYKNYNKELYNNNILNNFESFSKADIRLFDIPDKYFNMPIKEINKPKDFINGESYANVMGYVTHCIYINDYKNNYGYKLIQSNDSNTYHPFTYLSKQISKKELGIYMEWDNYYHRNFMESDYILTNIDKQTFMKYFPEYKGEIINEYPDTLVLKFQNPEDFGTIEIE